MAENLSGAEGSNVDKGGVVDTSGEGNQAASWMEGLSDEYKSHASLKDYKDINGVAKSLIEAQGYIGDSVRVPKEEATEEEWNKYFDKLGRPETSDKYLSDIKLPEGMDYNQDMLKDFQDLAHKLGLSQKQFKSIKEHYDNKAIESFNTQKANKVNLDAEFDKIANQRFGQNREKILTSGRNLLNMNSNSEDKEIFAKLDNRTMVAFASVLENIRSKHIAEDSGSMRNTSSPTQSNKDIESKMNELSAWLYKNTHDKMSTEFKQKAEELDRFRRIKGINVKSKTN